MGKKRSELAKFLKARVKKSRRVAWAPDPSLLLCPQIPKPMSGLAPRVVLGENWWNRTRLAAYKSTNYHCAACGVSRWEAKYHRWLEGHEVYATDYVKGRHVYVKTIPLCHFCHNYIHRGRLNALLVKGEIHQAKYIAIIQHGDKVLLGAGIDPRETILLIHAGPIAKWGKWRMVVNGKSYKPLYRTPTEWEAKFS